MLDRIFGIDPSFDRTNTGWGSLIHEDDRALMADYLVNEVIGKHLPFDKEYRIVQPVSREVRWVHGMGRLDFDEHGQPSKMRGIVQDITERCEKKVLTERLSIVAATLPGAIFAFRRHLDGGVSIPFLEGGLAQVFGVAPERLVDDASLLLQRIHPDDVNTLIHDMIASENLMQSWQSVFRVIQPATMERWLEIASIPHRHPDGGLVWHGYLADVSERVVATQHLEQSHAQLRSMAAQLEIVREEERTHIAREIHDELGQTLTSIRLNLAQLKSVLEPSHPEPAIQLEYLESTVIEALQAVRRISRELRPKILDTLELAEAIHWEVSAFGKRVGIRCNYLSSSGEVACAQPIKNHVYRIFQEAMTNIARHARATRVDVCLEHDADRLILVVEDNGIGIGFDAQAPSKNTLGLAGMQERANLIGGTLELKTTPMVKGTRVSLDVPLFPNGPDN